MSGSSDPHASDLRTARVCPCPVTDHPPRQSDITLPLLPLRDVVVFPHMVIPLFVGSPEVHQGRSRRPWRPAGRSCSCAQKAAAKDEPGADDIYEIGCVSSILQMLKLPDGTVKVLVEGSQRARVASIDDGDAHFTGELTPVPPTATADARDRGPAPRDRSRSSTSTSSSTRRSRRRSSPRSPASTTPAAWPTPSPRTCRSSSSRSRRCSRSVDVARAAREAARAASRHELDILQVEKRIRGRVKRQMEKSQREYYLNEQVKAIQKELGEGEDGADLEELEKKIKAARMPKEAREEGRAPSSRSSS
jgi:ATP-dependent Lon protease